jgi:hypothetical protein
LAPRTADLGALPSPRCPVRLPGHHSCPGRGPSPSLARPSRPLSWSPPFSSRLAPTATTTAGRPHLAEALSVLHWPAGRRPRPDVGFFGGQFGASRADRRLLLSPGFRLAHRGPPTSPGPDRPWPDRLRRRVRVQWARGVNPRARPVLRRVGPLVALLFHRRRPHRPPGSHRHEDGGSAALFAAPFASPGLVARPPVAEVFWGLF